MRFFPGRARLIIGGNWVGACLGSAMFNHGWVAARPSATVLVKAVAPAVRGVHPDGQPRRRPPLRPRLVGADGRAHVLLTRGGGAKQTT